MYKATPEKYNILILPVILKAIFCRV